MTKFIPIARAEARQRGLTRYFTGKPCRYGHVCERSVANKRCIECRKIDASKRYHDNTEIISDIRREYYIKNKKAISQRNHNNRSQRNKVTALWRKDNPETAKLYNQKRRARKQAAQGTHTLGDLDDIRRMQCDKCAMPWCRAKLKGEGHVDHIVALSCGGSDDRKNLQFLCAPCNLHKRTQDMTSVVQQHGFLL